MFCAGGEIGFDSCQGDSGESFLAMNYFQIIKWTFYGLFKVVQWYWMELKLELCHLD